MAERETNATLGKDGSMSKRISAFNYVMKNLRRVSLLMATFGMFLVMIYSIGVLIDSSDKSYSDIALSLSEKFQVICLNETTIKLSASKVAGGREVTVDDLNNAVDGIVDEIKVSGLNDFSVKNAVKCDVLSFGINTVVGKMDMGTVFLTDAGNVQAFLDYAGAELVNDDSTKSRMPQGEGEILIGETFSKNIGKGVGDKLVIKKSKEYTIVGIIKYVNQEHCYLSVGVKYNDAFAGGVVLFAGGTEVDKNEAKIGIDYSKIKDDTALSQAAKNGLIGSYSVDYTTREKLRENFLNVFNRAASMIKTVATVMIFIGLIVIFNLYMRDRYSEWCLLNSIGYSAENIYFLIVRELLIILGGCLIISVVSILGFYAVLVKPVIESLCLAPVLYIPDGIVNCVSISVMFFGILQVSVFYAIQQIKTVDAVDDGFI